MKRLKPLLLVLLPLPFLFAGFCTPTHQACSQGEGPIVCEEGEMPSCINHCFPTVPASEAVGAACVVDPCDAELVDDGGVILCPRDFACVPDMLDSPSGTCVPHGTLTACETDGTPPCPTDTFCREFGSNFDRPEFVDDSAEGMCMPFITEGSPCVALGDPTRLECEPGTYCRATDPEDSPVWTCVRPCESESDCPCAQGGIKAECVGQGSSAPTCSSCASVGTICETSEKITPCCGEAVCDDARDGIVEDNLGLCCLPKSAECVDDSQCCGSTSCQEGTCTSCGGVGEAPADAGCCGSLTEVDDVCSRDCEWNGQDAYDGQSCNVTGAHESCDGEIACTPAGAECRAKNISYDNDCDGIDDDCDGVPDDDYPAPECEDTPPGCQDGFIPSFPGREVCEETEPKCHYAAGLQQRYCRLDSSGSVSGPGDCVVGQRCDSESECSPGEHCGPLGTSVCKQGEPGCCEAPGSDPGFVPCCRLDPGKAGMCWNPGDPG